MIITLANADFSGSNIGTLSTWNISRSLGSGATYSGPNYVDKGAALSATVTLGENYELGTDGITITMGGATLSGAYTISGKVITISIAEVTGNVVIKVPTKSISSGGSDDDDEGGVTNYTFTINPTPSDATVKLTASGYTQSGNSITVASGTSVVWSVSKDGYTSQNGTQVVTSTSTKSVTLTASGSGGNTVQLFGANRTIVSSMSEMNDFEAKLALSATSALTNVTGRASDHTHALAVSAGQSITLSQPITGVTLTYAIVAFNSSGAVASTDKNFSAQAWISTSVTLPANTAYIMVAFKRGDGNTDFSADELALLPSALTIS